MTGRRIDVLQVHRCFVALVEGVKNGESRKDKGVDELCVSEVGIRKEGVSGEGVIKEGVGVSKEGVGDCAYDVVSCSSGDSQCSESLLTNHQNNLSNNNNVNVVKQASFVELGELLTISAAQTQHTDQSVVTTHSTDNETTDQHLSSNGCVDSQYVGAGKRPADADMGKPQLACDGEGKRKFRRLEGKMTHVADNDNAIVSNGTEIRQDGQSGSASTRHNGRLVVNGLEPGVNDRSMIVISKQQAVTANVAATVDDSVAMTTNGEAYTATYDAGVGNYRQSVSDVAVTHEHNTTTHCQSSLSLASSSSYVPNATRLSTTPLRNDAALCRSSDGFHFRLGQF